MSPGSPFMPRGPASPCRPVSPFQIVENILNTVIILFWHPYGTRAEGIVLQESAYETKILHKFAVRTGTESLNKRQNLLPPLDRVATDETVLMQQKHT